MATGDLPIRSNSHASRHGDQSEKRGRGLSESREGHSNESREKHSSQTRRRIPSSSPAPASSRNQSPGPKVHPRKKSPILQYELIVKKDELFDELERPKKGDPKKKDLKKEGSKKEVSKEEEGNMNKIELQAWFDSYPALRETLKNEEGRTSKHKGTPLANIPVLRSKDGHKREIALGDLVDIYAIKYVGEMDYEPVTRINPHPKWCPSALWGGKGAEGAELFLGCMKDSGNVEEVLAPLGIDAVVSVHPDDNLAKQTWGQLYKRWDGNLKSLKDGWEGKKLGQCLIEIEDKPGANLRRHFEMMFDFVNYYLSQGKKLMFQCKMGRSRSASLLIVYMIMKYHKLFPKESLLAAFQTAIAELDAFTDEISSKRNKISTRNFRSQMLEYLSSELRGDSSKVTASQLESDKQAEPPKENSSGRVIKVAVLIFWFIYDLKPTTEIRNYWRELGGRLDQRERWIAASEDKDEMIIARMKKDPTKVADVKRMTDEMKRKTDADRLAEYDKLFKRY